ncbi:TonB-dependent receptor [Brevundimonas sp. M20]|uniref:TonB-dependent receptor n=1 Tax=Brevundimonas sp. M20 TaxID=2591463 RepID=UPI001146344A|nr:TonB-dependent receptor [Brevundimonas sp. M20]QDH74537.1 TonB-dependent receptor [Brevundimonas sp. M20]
MQVWFGGREPRVVARGRSILLAGASVICWAVAAPAFAQDAQDAPVVTEDATLDEVVVTGTRRTMQSSIETKRQEATIVDALTADEIGDLPALSVGEAIETITGAASHREKGGASEIAIRGMGPFLGASTFNGREASNGSGDRSVNFNQFPSELINQIKVYKTQQANLIEGGVSGLVELGTLRPLDFNRRRIQIEGKVNYNPYEDRLLNQPSPGYRGTLSFVDQFDLGGLGKLGLSLGFQRNDVTNPEEVYNASSTWVACNATTTQTGNCAEVSRAQAAAGTPFYLVPNSYIFRQIEEDDTRDAWFGAVQWRPNDRLNVNLDYQYSDRSYNERRNELGISEGRYGLTNRVVDENHVLQAVTGNSSIETNSTFKNRSETYEGAGLNIEYFVNESLTLKGDVSWSHTLRNETDRNVRLRSDPLDIYGVRTPMNNQRVPYTMDLRNGPVPTFTIDPRFDITNHDLFSDDARIRRDQSQRDHEIFAGRFDATYEPADGFFTAFDAGVRYSTMTFTDFDNRVEFTQDDRAVDRAANLLCRTAFPQNDFLDSSSSNSIKRWATFDAVCLFEAYSGVPDTGLPIDIRAVENRDVSEDVWAAYGMASFAGMAGDLPFRGNVGLRVVDTQVTSKGLRADLNVVDNGDGTISLVPTGEFDEVVIEHGTTRWLPSLNLTFELKDDLLLRGGLFRAMSRPAPSALGAGRIITVDSGADYSNVADALRNITANGSPRLEPLMSWNADLSLEYYANRDSMFALAVYAKQFTGGFRPVAYDETFVIDGQSVTVPVVQTENSDDESTLLGFEVTGAYRFSSLPAPFDGLGIKVSYSYADLDFENEDVRLGDVIDAATGAVTEGMIPPAGLSGLSKDVLSAQLYYQIGDLDLQAIYKYRSDYYQDFVGGNSQLRYVHGAGTLDLRASYQFGRDTRLQFEAINITDEPRIEDMPVWGSTRGYYAYGSKYYVSMRRRF